MILAGFWQDFDRMLTGFWPDFDRIWTGCWPDFDLKKGPGCLKKGPAGLKKRPGRHAAEGELADGLRFEALAVEDPGVLLKDPGVL